MIYLCFGRRQMRIASVCRSGHSWRTGRTRCRPAGRGGKSWTTCCDVDVFFLWRADGLCKYRQRKTGPIYYNILNLQSNLSSEHLSRNPGGWRFSCCRGVIREQKSEIWTLTAIPEWIISPLAMVRGCRRTDGWKGRKKIHLIVIHYLSLSSVDFNGPVKCG